MALRTLENSDHVVVSVSIDFPTNSKRDALFHCIAYDYNIIYFYGLWTSIRKSTLKYSLY